MDKTPHTGAERLADEIVMQCRCSYTEPCVCGIAEAAVAIRALMWECRYARACLNENGVARLGLCSMEQEEADYRKARTYTDTLNLLGAHP